MVYRGPHAALGRIHEVKVRSYPGDIMDRCLASVLKQWTSLIMFNTRTV